MPSEYTRSGLHLMGVRDAVNRKLVSTAERGGYNHLDTAQYLANLALIGGRLDKLVRDEFAKARAEREMIGR